MSLEKIINDLPRNREQWVQYAKRAGLLHKSLRHCKKLQSGSCVNDEQFMLFRTICPQPIHPDYFNPADHGLDLTTASNTLAMSQGFQAYLNQVGTNNFRGLGEFGTTLVRQWEVLEGFRNRDDPLKCSDETPVKSSLISLLQALSLLPTTTASEWRSTRLRLRGTFGSHNLRSGESPPQFVAITDGQLQDKQTGKIKSVTKCKRYLRDMMDKAVDMEEAAEVVAWVSQYPDTDRSINTHHRVLVSKDECEIWITFAGYDNSWADYLDGRGGSGTRQPSLMAMQRYGPYNIGNRRQVLQVSTILLAISL
ncbi:uncharacterized protein BO88DRAFT_434568 [Aspergillus vadensis CBS 113365]|uniref:Uncharacterized protein n=1 Tax=Aspergillus vadensis (strain CBS 113365 / IMI 142717 / IBT 24658) TaxID=1448311 RepID=A0A319CPN6_ASPVC|nr:hypothetical protein BO88DRAFT_434568 [Aspergillus vadensis CBS 113365]PYH70372.1 hypothetical protein BO88DRAFT_434568 [Aspergillus vadensis CBS 113365]